MNKNWNLQQSSSHFILLLKSDLDVQQTGPRGLFVEQKLMLNLSFRCNQIYKYESYDFGHPFVLLKSDLDVQQTHLRSQRLVCWTKSWALLQL